MNHPVNHEALMRYLDDELPTEEWTRVDAHVRECSECSREIAVFGAMSRDLRTLEATGMETVWHGVSRRVTQPVGWMLVVVGALVYVAWGVYSWWTGPDLLWEKLAGGALVLGLILLLSSAAIDRMIDLRTDPYRNVQR